MNPKPYNLQLGDGLYIFMPCLVKLEMIPGLVLCCNIFGLFQAFPFHGSAVAGRFRDDSGGAPAVHDGYGGAGGGPRAGGAVVEGRWPGAGAKSTLSRGR